MSAQPNIQAPPDPGRLPMTLPLLREKKRLGDPIVMITAYDYPSARAATSWVKNREPDLQPDGGRASAQAFPSGYPSTTGQSKGSGEV